MVFLWKFIMELELATLIDIVTELKKRNIDFCLIAIPHNDPDFVYFTGDKTNGMNLCEFGWYFIKDNK
jgi:hypothetical protein